MKSSKTAVLMILFIFLSGTIAFAERSKVLTASGWVPEPAWSDEEKKAPVAKKLIAMNQSSSSFFIRLQESEEPHLHENHDLTVVVLDGEARIHYRDRAYDLRKGDIQEIPKGTPHWVEKKGKRAVLAYAVFSPPLEGKDYVALGKR